MQWLASNHYPHPLYFLIISLTCPYTQHLCIKGVRMQRLLQPPPPPPPPCKSSTSYKTFLPTPFCPIVPRLPSFPLTLERLNHPLPCSCPFPNVPPHFATARTPLYSLNSKRCNAMQHNGLQAAAAAAAEAAARRGAEAAARQAHRQELRQREEAQALQNLRAFKDSIKAAVSRVSPPASGPCSPPLLLAPAHPPPPPLPSRHSYCLYLLLVVQSHAMSCDLHVLLGPGCKLSSSVACSQSGL